jgi:hypothetical protein
MRPTVIVNIQEQSKHQTRPLRVSHQQTASPHDSRNLCPDEDTLTKCWRRASVRDDVVFRELAFLLAGQFVSSPQFQPKIGRNAHSAPVAEFYPGQEPICYKPCVHAFQTMSVRMCAGECCLCTNMYVIAWPDAHESGKSTKKPLLLHKAF